MATITAGEFRNGKVFEMEGKYYQVVEFRSEEHTSELQSPS